MVARADHQACGGEPVDYPAKIKCCGFPIIAAREETALGELVQPIEQAIEAGADAMVTPCPLCHLSLDAWQQKLEKATGRDLRPADHPPVAADRRGRRARGVGAEVPPAHRLGAARAREARAVAQRRARFAALRHLNRRRGGFRRGGSWSRRAGTSPAPARPASRSRRAEPGSAGRLAPPAALQSAARALALCPLLPGRPAARRTAADHQRQ